MMSIEQKSEYNCEICNRDCKCESQWTIHINSLKHKNGGIRPRKFLSPKCDLCPFESNNASYMNEHILNKHFDKEKRKKESKYYCNECDFGSYSQIVFNKHLETVKHINKSTIEQLKSKLKSIEQNSS